MNLLWPFSTPHHKEVAELRDRCIVAETKNILLADELERARRPKRERRRDAGEGGVKYPHPTFGWDATKLCELTYAQLNDLREAVESDPASRNQQRGSIYLYTKAAMRKTDALGWAVRHKQQAERKSAT